MLSNWTGTPKQRFITEVIYQVSKCLAVFALVMLAVAGIQYGQLLNIGTQPAPSQQFNYSEVTDQFNVADSSNNWEQLRNAYTECAKVNTEVDQVGACQQDAYIIATTPKGK